MIFKIFYNNSRLIVSYKIFFKKIHVTPLIWKNCKSSIKGPPWSVLFVGTDKFALQSLKPLCAKLRTGTLLSHLGVVSKPGTVIYKFARDENLLFHDWPVNLIDIKDKYHLGIVVSFGHLLPNTLISSLPLGFINVHASLLPRWRGAAPIYHSVMNGDNETGVTIMRIRPKKFDIGDIIRQYRIPIDPNETAEQLERKLAICGSQLLMESIRDLPRCLDMAVPQTKIGVTYANKINQTSSIIDLSKITSIELYNLHRALQHIYPLLCSWKGNKVKFREMQLDVNNKFTNDRSTNVSKYSNKKLALNFLNNNKMDESGPTKFADVNEDYGRISYDKEYKLIKVLCVDNKYVIIKKLTIFKKTISGVDFYNGYLSKTLETEWYFKNIDCNYLN